MAMSAPDLDGTDEASVIAALRSGVLGIGPNAVEFEELAAGVAGTTHGVAVSSGTAGLHLIVHALGIGRGDEVLVPSFTFAASANAIVYEGATPIFVDIEPETYNVDVTELVARRTPQTRAAMVVDVFGHPADWDAIGNAAEGLILIDDCCEAIGATYRDRPMGSFGAAGCFAFYPNKQMTTGEGGMVVTDDAALAALCRSLRNQGRGEMGAWLHHERLGFNYRMDELSAALGVSQIRRLDSFLGKRARVAQMYTERLANFEWLRPPMVQPHVTMSWFVYVVTLVGGHRPRSRSSSRWPPRASRAGRTSLPSTFSRTSASASARAKACSPSPKTLPAARSLCRSTTASRRHRSSAWSAPSHTPSCLERRSIFDPCTARFRAGASRVTELV